MAFTHGRNAVFKLDDGTNTLRDLTTYCEEVAMPRSMDTAEIVTMGSSAKQYLLGLPDATISFSGKWDPTADGYLAGALDALIAGTYTTLSFEYYPEGATGVKYDGEAIMTSYETSASSSEVVSFSCELQVSGAVTRTP